MALDEAEVYHNTVKRYKKETGSAIHSVTESHDLIGDMDDELYGDNGMQKEEKGKEMKL
ncbi:6792_t:CDS:2 [Paraglomus brasilianum]|uniref:6792_t:CDS:1 n=1 Tax=Paraglomus brasilianum TaxID=144538 RepID=A0A9N8VK57_9GLOM|nr:6792_t:CDS:2 [Paraglomus brasilianum]